MADQVHRIPEEIDRPHPGSLQIYYGQERGEIYAELSSDRVFGPELDKSRLGIIPMRSYPIKSLNEAIQLLKDFAQAATVRVPISSDLAYYGEFEVIPSKTSHAEAADSQSGDVEITEIDLAGDGHQPANNQTVKWLPVKPATDQPAQE